MTVLSDPLKVKGLTLKCRIVMPPMNTEFATQGGAVTERLVEHYVKLSEALGLLVVEHSYVSLQGKLSERQLGMHDDRLIPGLKKLVQRVHDAGTPIVAQINHAGARSSEEITGMSPIGPSAAEGVHALKINEIENITCAFAAATERAMKAGFDGVEVHGAHGFLLNQFFSPLTNRRNDKYGGSLENRMRFPLEVAEKIAEMVRGKVLMFRVGADDLNPAGTSIEDSKKFAVKLQDAGVDIIDVSGGLCGSSPVKLQSIQGYFVDQAHQIKEVVNVPVIGVGGIKEPEYAARLIRDRVVDLVAVGRELLKNPEWAVKTLKISEKHGASMMPVFEKIELEPVGFVETDAVGDQVKDRKAVSRIVFRDELVNALNGIEDFSHLFVLFWMHRVSKEKRKTLKVHPRGRSDMPLLGIFATRTPYRPNPIGLTLVKILKVENNIITVVGLDAFDGTPVLDIKPFDPWDTAKNAIVPKWWSKLQSEKSKNPALRRLCDGY